MQPLVDSIVSEFLALGATDMFLSAGKVPHCRLAGRVTTLENAEPLSEQAMRDFWLRCGGDPEEGADYDKRYQPEGVELFVRANLYRSLGALSAALRPIKNVIPEMEDLNLPASALRTWFGRDSGLILVTGASGSGKSTTVASALQDLSRSRQAHVLTIEDPIEYVFQDDRSFFSQREIMADTADFAAALRASLRQNPDVIFVGEIRDEETASIALRAAESGHLVAATLHSSGAVEAIERLSLLFPPGQREGARRLFSQQLIGVLAQLLIPAEGGGLFPVVEMLDNDGAVRGWLNEARYPEIMDLLSRDDGAVSVGFLRALVRATRAGIISEENAREVSKNPHDFNRLMSGFL